ncbi:hypothetical protein FB639_002348 [Coemansia asiatica]|nr:hypothetical protein FB639_002348 [Coemansia asiatica]
MLSAIQYVVFGGPVSQLQEADKQKPGHNGDRNGQCPPPSKCYTDYISPPCSPGKLCSMVMRPVVACAWGCGVDRFPSQCTQRCKPCKAEICTDVCECEIVCPIDGPCKAKPNPNPNSRTNPQAH